MRLPARRGRLPAPQRRLAYDALPAFRQLQSQLHAGGVSAAGLREYAARISELLVIEPDSALAPEAALWDLLQVAHLRRVCFHFVMSFLLIRS